MSLRSIGFGLLWFYGMVAVALLWSVGEVIVDAYRRRIVKGRGEWTVGR